MYFFIFFLYSTSSKTFVFNGTIIVGHNGQREDNVAPAAATAALGLDKIQGAASAAHSYAIFLKTSVRTDLRN